MKKSDFMNTYKSLLKRLDPWMSACKKQIESIKRKLNLTNISTINLRLILGALGVIFIAVLVFSLSRTGRNTETAGKDINIDPPLSTSDPTSPTPTPEETDDPVAIDYTVIDLSKHRSAMETSMLRINDPTLWGREVIFSAGNTATIDEPVLTELFIHNMDTGEDNKIASTDIKYGEIYEARISQDYIVWLDTDQRGTNIIYYMDRKTREINQVKKSSLTHPQLRLFGDNLVWVEQVDQDQDRLYLYNFKSGEPVILETFDSSSYGTCPPSIYKDMVVWAYPHPDDPGHSIIKKLDLKEALSISPQNGSSTDTGSTNGQGDGSSSTDDPNSIDISIIPEGSQGEADEDDTAYEDDTGLDPVIIDPKGFAIYPVTNGSAVAWLDSLFPAKATLKLTLNDGGRILDIAKGVGRIFGIGDSFIAYMQDESIMLYFWEAKRYAVLTTEGEAGRLSDISVVGNAVIWYDANDPSQTRDKVMISFIDPSMLK